MCVSFREHSFDKPAKRKVNRNIKFGSISKPSEPSRGALPVRQYHRKDESKILPSKRLGISIDDKTHTNINFQKYQIVKTK